MPTGRVRAATVMRIDETEALVVDIRRGVSTANGDEIVVAWSDEAGWATARCAALPWVTTGPDAGLLRLGLLEQPHAQAERRSGARLALRVSMRGTVEGNRKRRDVAFAAETLDISIGGAAIASEVDLDEGDRLKVRLTGPDGPLPGDVSAEVLRVELLPGRPERKVVVAFRRAPLQVEQELRRLIAAAA